MYTRRQADAPTGNYADRLGWDTTTATKGLLHEEAMQLLREGTHGIRSLRLARQMETYVRRGSGRTGPIPGARSDLLLAWMIAQTVASEKAPRVKRERGQVKRVAAHRMRYRVDRLLICPAVARALPAIARRLASLWPWSSSACRRRTVSASTAPRSWSVERHAPSPPARRRSSASQSVQPASKYLGDGCPIAATCRRAR